ncbi:MAG TPA: putative metal-binding motif-containing protein [Myxococcota bacterium]
MRLFLLLIAAIAASCTPRPSPPILTAVNPPSLVADFGGSLSLEGDGFLPAGALDFDRPDASAFRYDVSATVEREGVTVPLTDVTWRSPQSVAATLPAGLAPGAWNVTLITPRGQVLTLSSGLVLEAFVTDSGTLLDGGLPDGGAIDAGPQPCETFTFRDDDGDAYGLPDSGAFLCGPGRAPDAGDCNDVDRLTSPSGLEVCNGLDDDCDGTPDEQGCTDAGLRRLFTLEDFDNDFLAASAFTPDQLWVGGGTRLYVRRTDGGFRSASMNCPTNISALWAEPVTAHVSVGGGNNGVGRLTTAEFAMGGCPTANLIPEPVAGMKGFPDGDGGTRLWVIMRDGRTLAPWDGMSAPVVQGTLLANSQLTRADTTSPGRFFAVGGLVGTPLRPLVVRLQPDGTLVREALPPGLPDGWLRDVWALNDDEAVAVGDEGMVLVRRWGRWERVGAPQAFSFTSVAAFSPGRFYAATDAGQLTRYDGRWLTRQVAPRAIRQMTGLDEEHLWLVGDDGLILTGAPVP